MEQARIILIDDEASIRIPARGLLELDGHQIVDEAGDMEGALRIIGLLINSQVEADVLISDRNLTGGGAEGAKIIKIFKVLFPNMITVAFTGEPDGIKEAHRNVTKPDLPGLRSKIIELPEPGTRQWHELLSA